MYGIKHVFNILCTQVHKMLGYFVRYMLRVEVITCTVHATI